MNAKIALSHSDFHRYKIKGFSEAQDFLNERAVSKVSENAANVWICGEKVLTLQFKTAAGRC